MTAPRRGKSEFFHGPTLLMVPLFSGLLLVVFRKERTLSRGCENDHFGSTKRSRVTVIPNPVLWNRAHVLQKVFIICSPGFRIRLRTIGARTLSLHPLQRHFLPQNMYM